MGNHRFRLSDMMPNAWFYKLKDMGRSRNNNSSHPSKKKQPPTSSSSFSSTSSLSSSAAAPPQPLKPKQPHLSKPRKSYYFAREVTAPPSYNNSPSPGPAKVSPGTPKVSHTHLHSEPSRKSSNRRHSSRRRNRASTGPTPWLVTSSVSAGCSCRATLESVWTKPDSITEGCPISPADSSSDIESLLPEFGSDDEAVGGTISLSSSCRCRTSTDIVIDMDSNSFNKKSDGIDLASDQLHLAPIITKKESSETTKLGRSSAKFVERKTHGSLTVKVAKEQTVGAASKEQRSSPVRRLSATSPGVRLRTNSPRIASRKIQSHGRRSLSSGSSVSSRKSVSETLAVVKSSSDPHKDFRDSMVEMIVENNLRASKDLEELLACYLSLNSDVYHDLIIKVFKQIWFDLSDNGLK